MEFCRQWKALDERKLGDREEELCYLVVNILFTVMWRGVEGASKDAWKVKYLLKFCIVIKINDIVGARSGFGVHKPVGLEQRAVLIAPGIKAQIARDGTSSISVGSKG